MATLIVKHKHYPSYKPSGIEWLGDVPAHWEVRRASRLFSIGSGTTPPSERSEYYGGDIPWVTTSELRETIVTSTEKTITEEALRNFPTLNIFPEGSIAVAMYGATIGRLGILGVPATVNQACCVFSEPKGMNAGFWFFWLQSRRHYLTLLGQGGGQPNLSQKMLKSIRVPTPPLGEQAAIAVYLNRETAQIDALVTKKERLIELLHEKRTALISHTVTKGLNPNVPVKDSGIEWLGEIPTHWEVLRLKHLTEKIGSGKTPKGGAERYVEDGVMFLRSQNVHFGGLQLTDVAHIDTITDNEMSGSRVREGDVLLNITGASLGRSCVARLGGADANVNQHVCILRTDQRQDDPDFLAYSIESQSLQDQIFNNENGVSRDALNFEQIGDLVFSRPAIVEQQTIATFLDQETEGLDSLVAKVCEAIELLQEKRMALISAAVTGQIDIREEAECT